MRPNEIQAPSGVVEESSAKYTKQISIKEIAKRDGISSTVSVRYISDTENSDKQMHIISKFFKRLGSRHEKINQL